MNRTVCLDQYELQVEITRCMVVPANPHTWDSDWDYYGYQEMEFEVVSGLIYDEHDENPQDLGRNGCAAVAEQYAEAIEQKLWDQLNDEREAA
ncbi:hypothetical protein SA496_14375 [Pseudomonas sp. JS3066]|uniref:hypothetical protein n=1 Tax=Pseudomonas sp. JS3066 TaxID=3090665 RepID=UPI002E7AC8EE|nr:hypothetical protein [Pseudomonas sp. JS3066]WVK90931.1 hypothetical protein SA496_14375 [Pseudomonas sp. JS3066]